MWGRQLEHDEAEAFSGLPGDSGGSKHNVGQVVTQLITCPEAVRTEPAFMGNGSAKQSHCQPWDWVDHTGRRTGVLNGCVYWLLPAHSVW